MEIRCKSLTLLDLREAAGGDGHIKRRVQTPDEAYDLLLQAQEDLTEGFLTLYDEVEKVSNTEIMDWCDNQF